MAALGLMASLMILAAAIVFVWAISGSGEDLP